MFGPNEFRLFSRREVLRTASCGFGYLAFAGLCAAADNPSSDPDHPLAAKKPHFTPRAKRVIFMYMGGAPSHVDTFDYKPALARDNGKSADGHQKGRKLLKSPFKFSQHGKGGLWLEALFLAPEFHGRGGGRRLVRHAQELYGELTTDVNEQNLAARRFYESCGFVVEGRSGVDAGGRPFPLLHMRLAAPNR